MYIYGKRIRAWTGGRLEPSIIKEVEGDAKFGSSFNFN